MSTVHDLARRQCDGEISPWLKVRFAPDRDQIADISGGPTCADSIAKVAELMSVD